MRRLSRASLQLAAVLLLSSLAGRASAARSACSGLRPVLLGSTATTATAFLPALRPSPEGERPRPRAPYATAARVRGTAVTTTTTTTVAVAASVSVVRMQSSLGGAEGEPPAPAPRKKRGRPPAAKEGEPAAAAAAAAAAEEAAAKKPSAARGRKKAAAASDAETAVAAATAASEPPKRGRKPKASGAAAAEEEAAAAAAAPVKKRATAARKTKAAQEAGAGAPAAAAAAAKTAKKPAAAAAATTAGTGTGTGRATIPRSPTPRAEGLATLALPPGRRLVRLLSWNVAGLRGLMRKDGAAAAFRALLERERPDVLCLQETKLQEDHVAEVSSALKELHLPRFEGDWHCSVAKKGYSGTVVLVSQDSGLRVGPGGVRCGIGQAEGDGEGRVMTVDLGPFTLVNVYTPNSGEGLKRLAFRVGTWDRAFGRHLSELQRQRDNGAVLCCGDLNVAFADADFFNPEEPRTKKAAGTTPEERASFGELLEGTGMRDTFRHFHPEASGVYSYWSVRAGNRPYNRGMRLDYWLASPTLLTNDAATFPRVLDSFILDQEPALFKLSDHAPVGVVLAV